MVYYARVGWHQGGSVSKREVDFLQQILYLGSTCDYLRAQV